jgi:hypothetical protein
MVWVLQLLPESVVATMFPSPGLLAPTAWQAAVDGQAMPERSPVPQGTLWVRQVLPELVVARMLAYAPGYPVTA